MTIEQLTEEEQDHVSLDNIGAKALRIIDAQAAALAKPEEDRGQTHATLTEIERNFGGDPFAEPAAAPSAAELNLSGCAVLLVEGLERDLAAANARADAELKRAEDWIEIAQDHMQQRDASNARADAAERRLSRFSADGHHLCEEAESLLTTERAETARLREKLAADHLEALRIQARGQL